jgi:hypothetical protein
LGTITTTLHLQVQRSLTSSSFTDLHIHPRNKLGHAKTVAAMSLDEKKQEVIVTASDASPNVLTITRPSATRVQSSQAVDILSTIEDTDSSHSLTPTHTLHEKASTDRETSPFSPFYNPTPTRYSLEAHKSESKQNINVISDPFDTDVEACLSQQKTEASSSKRQPMQKMESTVWPGQKQMKQKKKMMRKERGKHNLCSCLAGMPKKQQIWIKILIALLVIGAAIGIGIGVSKAVGGGIWKSKNNTNSPIQGSGS